MKYKGFIFLLLFMLLSITPSSPQNEVKKPKVTVSPRHMIVHPGDTVTFTVDVERVVGGTFVCQGSAYIDLEHPSFRGLDYITFIQWKSEEFSLHEIGEIWTFEFIIRFKNETPEGRYVVPITVLGEVDVCPDAIPFEVTEFITFEVLKEPSNVSMKAWFTSPCNVCVIPDNTGRAQPGTTFNYPHRICNLGTDADTFTIEAKSSSGWNITIYWDVNNNKVLDSDETWIIDSTDLLSPDECYPLILSLEIPDTVVEGDTDTTTITTRSTSGECTDFATDVTTLTTGTPRTVPGLFECAEIETDTFVLEQGSCYVNYCVPYKIPVLMRVKITNYGPTELSDVKVSVEPQNFTIGELLPQYFIAHKMAAEEEKTIDIAGYFTSLPELGTYVTNITLYYTDQYGDQQTLSEQLLVKVEDTARNYFYQGETAYKNDDYETALEHFEKATELYVKGNFDVMVTEVKKYIDQCTQFLHRKQLKIEAEALLSEGIELFEAQKYELAKSTFEEALAIFTELKDIEKFEECKEWIDSCDKALNPPVNGTCLGSIILLSMVAAGMAVIHRRHYWSV